MAQFVEGSQLNVELENLIRNASKYLYLISPYIKLHDRIKDQLKLKREQYNLQIVVVFGKAEDTQSNRIKEEDLEFLCSFPNIEIRYEKNLHAKYYASEEAGLLTSMNLYDFSQNHNIEAGVLMLHPAPLVGRIVDMVSSPSLSQDALGFFGEVIENSELLFSRVPWVETSLLGLREKFVESKIEEDKLNAFFNKRKAVYGDIRTKAEPVIRVRHGYCIRTRAEIPFNIQRPLSSEAYQNWAQFQNVDYAEKYCHYSGENSDGQTSFARPVLKKNYRAAKSAYNF